MTKMTLITGAERRRRWSGEERERILAAASEPGAVVADVARRADVSTSLIYRWRRLREYNARASGFAPVLIADKPLPPAPRVEAAPIIVELGGALVRIGAEAPAGLVSATLRALRP